MLCSAEELAWASSVVGRWVPPTPQYVWPLLADRVGAEVWVKHENHTPTGAFKVRGGLVYAERLRAGRPEVKGVASATRGSHGQSLAFAGRAAGIAVIIVVPEGNSPDKNAAIRGFGAELVVYGHDFQSAREHAAVLGAQRGLETVPSYHRIWCSAWPPMHGSCSMTPGYSTPFRCRWGWVRGSAGSSVCGTFWA